MLRLLDFFVAAGAAALLGFRMVRRLHDPAAVEARLYDDIRRRGILAARLTSFPISFALALASGYAVFRADLRWVWAFNSFMYLVGIATSATVIASMRRKGTGKAGDMPELTPEHLANLVKRSASTPYILAIQLLLWIYSWRHLPWW